MSADDRLDPRAETATFRAPSGRGLTDVERPRWREQVAALIVADELAKTRGFWQRVDATRDGGPGEAFAQAARYGRQRTRAVVAALIELAASEPDERSSRTALMSAGMRGVWIPRPEASARQVVDSDEEAQRLAELEPGVEFVVLSPFGEIVYRNDVAVDAVGRATSYVISKDYEPRIRTGARALAWRGERRCMACGTPLRESNHTAYCGVPDHDRLHKAKLERDVRRAVECAAPALIAAGAVVRG